MVYRPGKEYGNADGISRPSYHTAECAGRGCVCLRTAQTIAQALEQFHEEPNFLACGGIMPSWVMNAYAFTEAQQSEVNDL